MVTSFSQFTPVKAKKMLRKSQLQFQEKLRKLSLRQKRGFLMQNVYENFHKFSTTRNLLCKNSDAYATKY